MREPSLREILDVAMAAAYEAGRRTLASFRTPLPVEWKSDGSPVTAADRESEGVLRAVISRAFPEHDILGEEGGLTRGTEPYRWIVDPIDGTIAFSHGVPLYGVLVGVEARTEPVAGVIYLPALDEMIAAARGLGCTWNGRPARVSTTRDLGSAMLLCSSARECRRQGPGYGLLAESVLRERTWGDAFGYAMIATGRADLMLDIGVAAWDLTPMMPIVEEAGGRFTDWSGRRTTHSGSAVASNGLLHDAAIAHLATSVDQRQDGR